MLTTRLKETHFERNPHVIKFARGEIPGNKDISAIKLIGADEDKIEKVEIQIGPRDTGILVYTGSDIHNLPIPEDGILFSRIPYIKTYLIIYFKSEYLESKAIDVPEIEITLCEPVHREIGEIVQTPFWEKVKETSFSPERLAILKEEGKYKDGKFLNTLHYRYGTAGKLYRTDCAD